MKECSCQVEHNHEFTIKPIETQDPMAPSRGLLIGIALGMVFWATFLVVLYKVLEG